MNIVTFTSPVSVAPPKLWIVSLYDNTLTQEALMRSKVGVLLPLSPTKSVLVPFLGKRSGYKDKYSKRDGCREVNNEWILHSLSVETTSTQQQESLDITLLLHCTSYIQIKLLDVIPAGDNNACLGEVVHV